MTRHPAPRLFAHVRSAALALLLLTIIPSVSVAQTTSASMLKAAFTLNFVKFTEWPGLKAGVPILVCVPADDNIANAMTQTMSGQSVDGHAIHVTRLPPTSAVRDCHLLFVTEREPRRLVAILEEAGQSPMLTVSDVELSAQRGVVIEFFLEKNRLRFAINVDTMERARVKVSSRLLSLATIVRDTDSR